MHSVYCLVVFHAWHLVWVSSSYAEYLVEWGFELGLCDFSTCFYNHFAPSANPVIGGAIDLIVGLE